MHMGMAENDVISAAIVSPGFWEDLSTWRVTISRDGRLRQDIRLCTGANGYKGESRREVGQVPADELAAMLATAERIGFKDFRDQYEPEDDVDDLGTFSISVRFDGAIKTVEAYGPDWAAEQEGNRDMAGFIELWEQIHRHAPYPALREATDEKREQPMNETRGIHRPASVVLLGVLLGAAIWWLSPMITGEVEPWDSQGNYYLVALFVAGFTSSLMSPRQFLFAPVGVYVGQFGYALLFLPLGPLLPLGMAVGLALSAVPLIGGAFAWAIFGAGVLDWLSTLSMRSEQ